VLALCVVVDQKNFVPFRPFLLSCFCRILHLFFPTPSHNAELLQQWFVSLNTDYPLQARVISHSTERYRLPTNPGVIQQFLVLIATRQHFLLTHLETSLQLLVSIIYGKIR